MRVSVPATSANLGPGFDSLGLALSLRDQLEAEVLPEGLVVEVTGSRCGRRAAGRGPPGREGDAGGVRRDGPLAPGLRLTCHNVVPHGRGLGSSAAAIVGGLVLARSLVADGAARLGDDALLRLAVELEGHPDNVAPALLGGFVVSGRDEDGTVYAARSAVDPRIGAVVFVPPDPVATETARGLLPDVRTPPRRGRERGPGRPAGHRPGRPTRAALAATRGPVAPAVPRARDARICSPSWRRCAPMGSRPSCRAPGRPCSRSWPRRSSLRHARRAGSGGWDCLD